jgi:hypothetical protein
MTDQITTVLTALKKSKFRSRLKLTEKDRLYILIPGALIPFASTPSISSPPDWRRRYSNDGKQTPMRGHPIFIA